MMEIWEKIPAAIRWVLLFPIAFMIVAIAGTILRISILAGGMPLPVFNLVFPPIMAVIYLFIVYLLAPSKKFKLIMALIVIRSLFIPMFLLGFYLYYRGVKLDMSWNEWWSPFIGEIISLVPSIWFYKYLKEEHFGVS